jgi:hypothetical protein
MTRRSALSVVLGAAVLGGCSTGVEPIVAPGYANSFCPVMGKPIEAGAQTVDFHGEKVAFCCPKCQGRWDALSDAEKSAKLAKAR